MMGEKVVAVTIIIPAYNEAQGIGKTLIELIEYVPDEYEILVIDDGSTDNTFDMVNSIEHGNIRCIRHKRNKGYGSAINTGCRNATGDIVVWYDADGQHRPEDLMAVVEKLKNEKLDYCIGIRSRNSHCDRNRKLGKFILSKIVNLLAKEPLKDFNSGLRAFKKEVLLRCLPLLPKRFGASTVTSFIMQEMEYKGGDCEILVRERIGKSTVKPLKDGIRTISLIVNIIILFRPREVFGTVGIVAIIFGVLYGVFSAFIDGLGIPVLSAIVCIFGIQTFFFGIISSQISQLRLERYYD